VHDITFINGGATCSCGWSVYSRRENAITTFVEDHLAEVEAEYDNAANNVGG